VPGLTQQAFEGLLRQFNEDAETAASEYETVRRKLTLFFELRLSRQPDSLTDETIDRVARKLDEGESISNLRAYFFGVAKRVLLESQGRDIRERVALETHSQLSMPERNQEGRHVRIECLKRCLLALPAEARDLILAYYEAGRGPSEEARRALADRLGLSYGNLKIRAHRIRGKLEQCLNECLADGEDVRR
jgi:RNA polymerase sigma factor (sigma-70 family)